MKADAVDPVYETVGEDAAETVVAGAWHAVREAWSAAKRLILDGVQNIRARSKAYAENPGQTADEARAFIFSRIRERPVTAVLAGLGVGVLLGFLFSSRER